MIGRQRWRHRRFDYEPRYYDPSKDDKLKQRLRIATKRNRRKVPNRLAIYIALLLFALFIMARGV
jgi:hypothetical protein